ncbi:uncharacterized protein TNCT_728271 [Trichonephila clavata]|uniref:Chromo domain-containing protein n=1 Tax=Trichonephila clavata TaxID=2740835 RepID=A0A8X6GLS8_TRICU|nr:uncharacterized protein TNCT_728271 [Trichonephila clavata]
MAPSQVTREVESQIFKKLYGFLEKNPKVILNKGDLVRISKANKTFRRGYLPGWSDEVFRVTKVYFSHPTTFELQDLKSEAIKGRFYAEELQKISKRSDDYWSIEKVLKTKGIDRKKEYYVKWQGFDERFNSWVKEAWMSSFKHLAFNLLANKKVKIHIPDTSAVTFQDGLKDLLGLKQSTLHGGTHISDYQLELDGGITEIYVYTDIIESHFVGDTIAPLLRIIPVMSTKEDQIVINYQRPLYFPLRQNYIDCIEVELKSSSEDGIIFTSDKSLLILSFRRRIV